MIELLKKSLYVSLGIATMTKDKVEELGKKFIKEARLSETEGKQFLEELLKKSEEMKASIETIITEKIDITLKKLKIPTENQFMELEKRVRKLEGKNGSVPL